MKTILAVTHLETDVQISHVSDMASSQGVRIIPICTNTISFDEIALVQNKGKIKFYLDGRYVNPSGIWFATYPREDTLFSQKMSRYPYPGEYRSTVVQFVLDLRFAFQELDFYPGAFESILKGDSKLVLFRIAYEIGINVPKWTINSSLKTKKLLNDSSLYRKKLGFPSVVSYSSISQKEEIVTTLNQITNRDSSCLIWQWQTPIVSVAHVRGVLVGNKAWFSRWDRKSTIGSIVDFRAARSDEDFWVKAAVEKSLIDKLHKLRIKLGLTICCPEFLITPQGKWVLIDLNPCGDWYGFFSKDERNQIASSIANLF